jgi:hypothetical protein
MTKLKDLMTEEEILEFALHALATKDYNMEGIEGEAITCYVLDQPPDLTGPQFAKEVSSVISQFIVRKLYLANLIHVDFDSSVPFSPSTEVVKLNERKKKTAKNRICPKGRCCSKEKGTEADERSSGGIHPTDL